MRCDECQLLIEDYFDGELEMQAASAVSLHLNTCTSCNIILEQLLAEQDVYRSYERGVGPTPAMWLGIQGRLQAKNPDFRANPLTLLRARFVKLFALPRISAWAAAVLVIIAIGLTVAVMKHSSRPRALGELEGSGLSGEKTTSPPRADPGPVADSDNQLDGKSEVARGLTGRNQRSSGITSPAQRHSSNASTVATNVVPARTVDRLVREAEQKYLAAIVMLSRNVERHRPQMDPETRIRFDQALAAIDRSIAGTRAAAREQPEDPVAVQYMLAAYAKKVDVLREMADY